MKILYVLLIPIFFLSCQQENLKQQTINPFLGDISFEQEYGAQPKAQTNEQLRIKTHLRYVEKLLRNKPTIHLSDAQLDQRNFLIDALHDYIKAEAFPKNYDYPDDRRPCFIDKDGNICAVGYLVKQSAGLAAAEEINSLFQYATIEEMRSDLLDNWIAHSGLSRNEVAMIQPTYGGRNLNQNYLGAEHGIPSFVLNVLNITFSTASIAKWNNESLNPNIPVGGIVSGITTLVYAAYYNSKSKKGLYPQTEAQKRVSGINTALGGLSLAINGFRLINYNYGKDNESNVSINLSSQPGINNQPAIGFVLNKRL